METAISPIRSLIVDDEPLARAYLRRLLEGHADFVIAGEAADGRAAKALLEAGETDVVFLDIQMPGLTGLEVIDSLPPAKLPMIVFVTAFDEFAVKAFDLHAVDYLLKPFDDARFAKMLDRVRVQVKARATIENQAEVLQSLGERLSGGGQTKITRLPLKHNQRVFIVPVEEIDWIEATDYYVTVHTGGRGYLLRESLTALEGQLDPARFVRTHRGALVNVHCIRALQPIGSGDYRILLSDGSSAPLSRRRKQALERTLGRTF